MSDATHGDEVPGTALPRGTTPTWEMELLISGATVFGLPQLPGALDVAFFDAMGRASDDLGGLLAIGWVYAQAALVITIATFVVHLVLRSYWVALVGLDSVYRGGVRWDRLRIGPHLRAVHEAADPGMAARIEAADNRATRVFGVGVGLALAMLVPMGVVAAAVLAYLLARALGASPPSGLTTFWIVFLLGFAPFLVLVLADRLAGSRIRPGSRAARWLRAALAFYARFGIGRTSTLPLQLFQSHAGARRSGLLVAVAILAATGVVTGRFVAQGSGLSWGDFAGLPGDDPGAADTAAAGHYATQRTREPTLVRVPYIQDRVVRGPYLELFVPYRPRRHAPALRAACPDAVAVAESGGPARGALDCLAGLLEVRIDGAPVPVRLDASEDPVSGQRGVLAMIPAEGLQAGRHELSLAQPPRRDGTPDGERYRIPFWR